MLAKPPPLDPPHTPAHNKAASADRNALCPVYHRGAAEHWLRKYEEQSLWGCASDIEATHRLSILRLAVVGIFSH